jgi:hypothetical protein
MPDGAVNSGVYMQHDACAQLKLSKTHETSRPTFITEESRLLFFEL